MSLKDRKDETIAEALRRIIYESGHKPTSIWADEGGEFYKRSMISWLASNNNETSSTHN